MRIAKIIATSMLSLALFAGCTTGKGIITVNGEGISKAQYNEMYEKVSKTPQFAMLGNQAKDPDSFFNLMARDRIVSELIAKALLEQEVEKRKIKVTDDDIKAQRSKIVEAVGGEERLKELIAQNGISDKQFEKDLENEVKINKLVEEVADVKVSDKEVKEYYVKNKSQFNFPDRVRASHILITSNPEQIRQEIITKDKKGALSAAQVDEKVNDELNKKLELTKEISAKLAANPDDFAKLAKEYSDDKASATKGGDLGFFTRESMVKPFADAAFKLKPGVISDVVVSEYGNHIILVTDRAKAGLQPFDKVEAEIKAYLEQTKKVEVLQKLFDGLKASAKIVYNDPNFDPENIQKKIRERVEEQAKKEKESGLDLGPITTDKKPAAKK